MSPSFVPRTQATANTSEVLPEMFLSEIEVEYFQRDRYPEREALFTSANEHPGSDQMPFAALFDMLTREYAKYTRLQQTLQDVSARFTEVHAELKASITALTALQSRLLIERNTRHPLQNSGYTQHPPEHTFAEDDGGNPTLYAVCLGPFEVKRLGNPITLCSNRNAQTILRYLITQSNHSATADTLMNLLWAEDPADVALRKLHVTISILRHALQTEYDLQSKYILYKHGVYQLNPSVSLHSDVKDFLLLYNAGQKVTGDAAAAYYQRACSLYTRPFLLEDLYSDWSFTQREQLRQVHLNMCSALSAYYLEAHAHETAAQWAAMIIEENPCDEAAHRQLMRIYALEGRRNDALRQYQRCQQILLDELNLQPMPETVALQKAIIHGEFH